MIISFHYMDILLAYSNDRMLQRLYEGMMTCLLEAVLQIATENSDAALI